MKLGSLKRYALNLAQSATLAAASLGGFATGCDDQGPTQQSGILTPGRLLTQLGLEEQSANMRDSLQILDPRNLINQEIWEVLRSLYLNGGRLGDVNQGGEGNPLGTTLSRIESIFSCSGLEIDNVNAPEFVPTEEDRNNFARCVSNLNLQTNEEGGTITATIIVPNNNQGDSTVISLTANQSTSEIDGETVVVSSNIALCIDTTTYFEHLTNIKDGLRLDPLVAQQTLDELRQRIIEERGIRDPNAKVFRRVTCINVGFDINGLREMLPQSSNIPLAFAELSRSETTINRTRNDEDQDEGVNGLTTIHLTPKTIMYINRETGEVFHISFQDESGITSDIPSPNLSQELEDLGQKTINYWLLVIGGLVQGVNAMQKIEGESPIEQVHPLN